ncbi:MAG: hypothetical protein RIR51_840 [Bacteroidota bacterium]|jgi:tRNA threonylcarbamoyladenosine biosynthesis protein TsaE
MENISYNIEGLHDAATFLLKWRKTNIVCLFGDMGIGKTTLVKKILEILEISNFAKSPSYDIVHSYEDKIKKNKIFHIDCYRIQSAEEALDLGIDECLNGNDLVFIEWPEKIMELLPVQRTEVSINHSGPNLRTLAVKNYFK